MRSCHALTVQSFKTHPKWLIVLVLMTPILALALMYVPGWLLREAARAQAEDWALALLAYSDTTVVPSGCDMYTDGASGHCILTGQPDELERLAARLQLRTSRWRETEKESCLASPKYGRKQAGTPWAFEVRDGIRAYERGRSTPLPYSSPTLVVLYVDADNGRACLQFVYVID